MSKRVDNAGKGMICSFHHQMVDQRGLEKRNDEAAGDHDVHDDAHVHVPHEHALLCKSSLRFSINADRFPNKEFRYHGGQ
jgi:hypothetical protein